MPENRKFDWSQIETEAELRSLCRRWSLRGAQVELLLLAVFSRDAETIQDRRIVSVDGHTQVRFGSSERRLATALKVTKTTVHKAVRRLETAGLASRGIVDQCDGTVYLFDLTRLAQGPPEGVVTGGHRRSPPVTGGHPERGGGHPRSPDENRDPPSGKRRSPPVTGGHPGHPPLSVSEGIQDSSVSVPSVDLRSTERTDPQRQNKRTDTARVTAGDRAVTGDQLGRAERFALDAERPWSALTDQLLVAAVELAGRGRPAALRRLYDEALVTRRFDADTETNRRRFLAACHHCAHHPGLAGGRVRVLIGRIQKRNFRGLGVRGDDSWDWAKRVLAGGRPRSGGGPEPIGAVAAELVERESDAGEPASIEDRPGAGTGGPPPAPA